MHDDVLRQWRTGEERLYPVVSVRPDLYETVTRLVRKGFKTSVVLYGPGVLMASGTRGYPTVGAEAFPGHMAINNQIKTLLAEGNTVYACRFAMGALYGFREDDLIPGVKAFNPLDVLDSALTAWREKGFQLNTWTV